MLYDGRIIRPPSEAGSLILQLTVGCSHNTCTFCPAYKDKQFRVKSPAQFREHALAVAGQGRAELVRRIFLCDGDPLCLPTERLVAELEQLQQLFPGLKRVGIYGRADNVLRKVPEDLARLRSLRLGIIYLGLESGDAVTLERVDKGLTPEQMIAAAKRIRAAGIKLNVSILLGAGGVERSREHACETMRVLNAMQPNHIGALTLMIVPGTPLHDQMRQGNFTLPDKFGLLRELRDMLALSELHHSLFFSNHASNYLPLELRLPRDRDSALAALDRVLAKGDEHALRGEWQRGL